VAGARQHLRCACPLVAGSRDIQAIIEVLRDTAAVVQGAWDDETLAAVRNELQERIDAGRHGYEALEGEAAREALDEMGKAGL
jgi:hypothetical protein